MVHTGLPSLPIWCLGRPRSAGWFIQIEELLVLGVVILGHEDWARRRLRVVERVGAHPCCECRPGFVAKAKLKELRVLSHCPASRRANC